MILQMDSVFNMEPKKKNNPQFCRYLIVSHEAQF